MCFSSPKIPDPPPPVETPVEDKPGEVLVADEAAELRGDKRKVSGRRALTIGLAVPKSTPNTASSTIY